MANNTPEEQKNDWIKLFQERIDYLNDIIGDYDVALDEVGGENDFEQMAKFQRHQQADLDELRALEQLLSDIKAGRIGLGEVAAEHSAICKAHMQAMKG